MLAALAIALAGMSRPAGVAAATFADIGSSIFKADIEWLAAEGITTGCSPTRFCPTDAVTREQMASFLARMFRLPGTTIDAFTDDEGSIHEADINRLAASGITTGCTATTFCPRRLVTRAQMASFIARAANLSDGAGNNYFYDDDGSAHEADIDRVAAAGVVTGCWDFRYCATRPVTREQMASFLHRVVRPVPSPPHPYTDFPFYGIWGYSFWGPPYVLSVGVTPQGGDPNQPDYVLEVWIIEEASAKLVGSGRWASPNGQVDLEVPVNAGLHMVQINSRWMHPTLGVQYELVLMKVNVGVLPARQTFRASTGRIAGGT